jgi:glycosyltransferase involved in cell wall biosynthesis
MSADKLPKVTVVTIAFNAEKFIQKTLESVIEQDFEVWKLAIVVSSESDSSLNYVRQLSQRNKKITVLIPDSLGIYQGMNFALDNLKPNLTWFLNGGDVFASRSVLSIALKYMTQYSPGILIGGYSITESGKRRLFVPKTSKISARRFSLNIRNGNHQSMLFDFTGEAKVKFNVNLEMAADFLLVLERLRHRTALRVSELFVEVEPGGISSKYIEKVWIEKQAARKEIFGRYSLDYLLGIVWTRGVKLKRFAKFLLFRLRRGN